MQAKPTADDGSTVDQAQLPRDAKRVTHLWLASRDDIDEGCAGAVPSYLREALDKLAGRLVTR